MNLLLPNMYPIWTTKQNNISGGSIYYYDGGSRIFGEKRSRKMIYICVIRLSLSNKFLCEKQIPIFLYGSKNYTHSTMCVVIRV